MLLVTSTEFTDTVTVKTQAPALHKTMTALTCTVSVYKARLTKRVVSGYEKVCMMVGKEVYACAVTDSSLWHCIAVVRQVLKVSIVMHLCTIQPLIGSVMFIGLVYWILSRAVQYSM